MRGLIKNLLSTQTLETAVLASLTALAAVILFPVLRQRLELDLNAATLTALIPFIGLGSSFLAEKPLNSLNILFSAFLPASLFLAAYLLLERLETCPRNRSLFLAGFIPLVIFSNTFTGLIVLIIAVPSFIGLKAFSLELNALLAHLFDVFTTIILLRQGFSEGMFLAGLFIDLIGFPGVLAAKLVFVVPAILLVSEKLDLDQKTYYLALIWLIGLAPGVYNLFLM